MCRNRLFNFAFLRIYPVESTPLSNSVITDIVVDSYLNKDINGSLVNQLNTGDTAKLTIHKIKGGFNGENQWGVEKGDVSGEPLDGIAFDIYKLDPDLTTLQGWKDYDGISGKSVNELVKGKEPVATVTTATVGGEKGVATFEGEVGVYAVVENLEKSETKGYTPAAPFITALPFTTEDGTAWNKDVHVYPKNQENKATKTVKDQGVQASQDSLYTISGTVPAVPDNHEGKYFDGYSLLDVYEGDKWAPKVEGIKAFIKAGDERTVTLDAGDFKVSTPTDYTTTEDVTNDKAFTISLTRSGLDKLEKAVKDNKGATVTVEADVPGTVNEGIKPGDLVNKARIFPPNIANPNWDRSNTPDDPNNPPTTPSEETEVVSEYGAIDLLKVSSEDDAALAGATFELHKCENGGARGDQAKLLDEKKSTPIEVAGKTSWTTDDQGKLTITGIQLEDWFDGAKQEDVFDYCLVEIKAPEGFELLPKPVNAQVNTEVRGGTAAELTSMTVANVPTTTQTFKLPATGEWGRWWLIGGGTLALLIAAGFAVQAANRKESAA